MSRFHDLGKRLAAAVDDDDEDEGCPSVDLRKPKSKDKAPKETDMTDEEKAAALAGAEKKGHDAGYKAAIDRINTVMASEHYAGREATAAAMLGKASMSAEDIVDILATTPKAETTGLSEEQQRNAAEEAGRKEMLAQIQNGKNSTIDANNGGGDNSGKERTAAETSAIWDRVVAKVCR